MKINWKKYGLSARRAKQIYKRGCHTDSIRWGDIDCREEYKWNCDYCPVVVLHEKMKNKHPRAIKFDVIERT